MINGKLHGDGVFTWPDGRKYEGHYFENFRNGPGVYTWPDGRTLDTVWYKNIAVGEDFEIERYK